MAAVQVNKFKNVALLMIFLIVLASSSITKTNAQVEKLLACIGGCQVTQGTCTAKCASGTLTGYLACYVSCLLTGVTLAAAAMDDEWRRSITSSNMVMSIKIIRNKITQQPEGYGFVEFASHGAAERVLQTCNDTLMPRTDQPFRLNWTSFGIGERCHDVGPKHSIFVGDLASDVTDYLVQKTFRAKYPSVRGAKVVTDPNTGHSKGYGFVKFSDEMERNCAMSEMNGVYCSSRPMRTPKKATGFQQPYTAPKVCALEIYIQHLLSTSTAWPFPFPAIDNDITNTTIFVGGLDPNVTEEELRQIFAQFGDLVYAKTIPGKGCDFVQFGTRQSAEVAIQRLNGTMIGQQTVRLSWGRSMTAKHPSDPHQWNGAYYGYGQGYDAYGYGAVPNPSLYSYGAYARYGRHFQAEGTQEMVAMAGVVPSVEQKEELHDPLATPNVDKLVFSPFVSFHNFIQSGQNAAYFEVPGSAMVGQPL
ncbi:hypothetical protein IFM89_006847 [Coptis chinensis]|uniref:RRM domain-containing protein n=1 Tax=Coptis chinensis TaxID=261450 RepID=A0A835LTN6_9MAGN|nr:hypothetical protein IFM89_006847 [Coptis chinensis]